MLRRNKVCINRLAMFPLKNIQGRNLFTIVLVNKLFRTIRHPHDHRIQIFVYKIQAFFCQINEKWI
jgi:hypothetical protein